MTVYPRACFLLRWGRRLPGDECARSNYFFTRFGLVKAGSVEDRPGIPPTPEHLVRLIADMKQQQVKLVVVEPWNDIKLAERVAQDVGAKVRVLAPQRRGGQGGR